MLCCGRLTSRADEGRESPVNKWLGPMCALLLTVSLPLAPLRADTATLTDLDGNAGAITDYTGRGQWTVVMIWSADCGLCRYEAPQLQAFHQRHKDANARVLGLSVDGPAARDHAKDFVRDTGVQFPNLLGDGEDVAALYHDHTGGHLIGTPAFLVFNPQGQLRAFRTGGIDLGALEKLIQPQPKVSAAERP